MVVFYFPSVRRSLGFRFHAYNATTSSFPGIFSPCTLGMLLSELSVSTKVQPYAKAHFSVRNWLTKTDFFVYL